MPNRLFIVCAALAASSSLGSVADAQLELEPQIQVQPHAEPLDPSQVEASSNAASNDRSSLPSSAPLLSPSQSDVYRLAIVDQPDSIYPPYEPPGPEEGLNAGAVNFDFSVTYWTRYVFRGVDQGTIGRRPENSLQFLGNAEFDLGKFPHPFLGLFVNVFNTDPVSRFEEVRPFAGLNWDLKPLTITAAYQDFIFPNRKALDTEEAWVRLELDDSRVWRTEKPVVSPYIYAAYDFDLYSGFYIEAGIHHDFEIQYTGLTITPSAAVAYVVHDNYFRLGGRTIDTGFQHYQLGVTLDYSLNQFLNIPQRYGRFHVTGSVYFDDAIDQHLRGDNRTFGGGGFGFDY